MSASPSATEIPCGSTFRARSSSPAARARRPAETTGRVRPSSAASVPAVAMAAAATLISPGRRPQAAGGARPARRYHTPRLGRKAAAAAPPTRPFVTKRILIGVVLVVLVGCGLGAAWWYHQQTEKKVIRGSPKDEFVITAGPEERESRPPKHGAWPMFGYDVERTKAAPFAHRPPFRFLWTVETHGYIEFPPALVDGRAFVANQAGRFLAIDVKRRKILWEKLLRRCVASGPAVSQGVVYLGVMGLQPCRRTQARSAQSGYLLAVSATTGKVKWRF